MHAVGLLKNMTQIELTLSCPQNWGPDSDFLEGPAVDPPDGWFCTL